MLSLDRTVLLPWRVLRGMQARLRQRQLVQRGWYDTSVRSDTPAIFVGGCPRSGTTLLREILSRHSAIAAGVESGLLAPPFDLGRVADLWEIKRRDMRRMVRTSATLLELSERLYSRVLEEQGKRRWVDKTAYNVSVVDRLLTWFPNAVFVHAVRDGRDVVCSLRHHPAETVRGGTVRSVVNTNPIDVCAHWWTQFVSRGLAFQNHPRVMEVRYEELVSRPEQIVRELCSFVGEAFEAEMLDPDDELAGQRPSAWYVNNRNASSVISGASVGRWRTELDRAERQQFVDVAGELLLTLGYVEDQSWVNAGTNNGADLC